jgi:hypothetical protein
VNYLDGVNIREDLATGNAFVTTMKDVQRVVDSQRLKARRDEMTALLQADPILPREYASARIEELNKRLSELEKA